MLKFIRAGLQAGLLFVALVASAAQAEDFYVGDGGSIRDAILAASDGDTVIIESNETFNEYLYIDSKSLTIKAGDGYSPTIKPYDDVPGVTVRRSDGQARSVVLEGLKIALSSPRGKWQNRITIDGVDMSEATHYTGSPEVIPSVYVWEDEQVTSSDASDLVIRNCELAAYIQKSAKVFVNRFDLTLIDTQLSILKWSASEPWYDDDAADEVFNTDVNLTRVELVNMEFYMRNAGRFELTADELTVLPLEETFPWRMQLHNTRSIINITNSNIGISGFFYTATDVPGAAERSSSEINISDSQLRSTNNNPAVVFFGYLSNSDFNKASVTRTKILGAILTYPGIDAKITNSIFTSNNKEEFSDYGFIAVDGAEAKLSNVTIAGFEVGVSPFGGEGSFENILFVGNTLDVGDPGLGDLLPGEIQYQGFSNSVLTNLENPELFDGINGNVVGTPLVDDALNLLEGSIGIDIGNNDSIGASEVDFYGEPRVQDGDGDGVAIVDVGASELLAIEVQPPANPLASVVENIDTLIPGTTGLNNLRLTFASQYLDYALNDAFWNDDFTLNSDTGLTAFYYVGWAVWNLELAAQSSNNDPELKMAIEASLIDIVAQMRKLASDQLNIAVNAEGASWAIGIAQRYLDNGDRQLDRGRFNNAISAFRTTWYYANIAS